MNNAPSEHVKELTEYVNKHRSHAIWICRSLWDNSIWYVAERVPTHNDVYWNSFGRITVEEAKYLHNNKIICVYHNFCDKFGNPLWPKDETSEGN